MLITSDSWWALEMRNEVRWPKSDMCGFVDLDLGGRRIHQKGVRLEGQTRQGASHQKEKAKQEMTLVERFVTEGNKRADELANDGAVKDGVQRREVVHAAFQCAASFPCFVEGWHDCEELEPNLINEWVFVDKNKKAQRHRTEWCAARNSKNMNIPGKSV